MAKEGLVQIYTGTGKGKTTAALGLALRAAGWEKKVIIYQFLKPPALKLGERKALAKTKLPIKIVPVDIKWNMRGKNNKALVRDKINQTCKEIETIAKKKKYDIITKIYGFAPNSFEAKTAPQKEAFRCFKSNKQMQ